MLSRIKAALNSHILYPLGLQLVRSSILPAEYWVSNKGPTIERKIIFIHPPKCGGTSVEKLLQQAFGVGEELSPFASREAANKLNISMQSLREILLAYQIYRSDKPLILGHYWYSERLLKGKADDFDLITILRNPRDRLLSQYYYNRHKKKQSHFGIKIELERWLEEPNAAFHANIYTHIFSGTHEPIKEMQNKNFPDPQNTDRAIQNLKNFVIVGIIEKQKEFEEKINLTYGIKSHLSRERPSPKADYLPFEAQPKNIQNKIDTLCAEDMRLYDTYSQ